MAGKRKVAVVLFNLGGPDNPETVRPFLFNLFRDRAIIDVPWIARTALAGLISTLRAPSAKKNYAMMGGGSPLRAETEKQAAALEARLAAEDPGAAYKCFIGMRYWKPFVAEAARAVREWEADEVVLLPLYPHFSITTTETAFGEWDRAYKGPADRRVCCYPAEDAFIDAHVRLIRETFEKAGRPEHARLLFSAHGLPRKTVDKGDPYPWQIEQTVRAIAGKLPEIPDWAICYQSRVGPLEWIGPSTDDEVARAAADGKAIILTPIAFVSEHIETLVELDVEYRELAEEHGAKAYHRVPALGDDAEFIEGLSALTLRALEGEAGLKPPGGARICPADAGHCPCRMNV
ncbi:ferrochelatase [Euryhalocaulis caribicus]|uniref:ferrochelatase n=1 Tax=Euryhalocaulis caribicus TaxID=1161401 RepID=UPI0003A574C3|nr:ferrochelatase [Euryhalocaulis caribicus]